MAQISKAIQISEAAVHVINAFLKKPQNELLRGFWDVLKKHGTPASINRQAEEARKLETQIRKLKKRHSPYLKDIEWLRRMRDQGSFISLNQYRRKILGSRAAKVRFNKRQAVVLEISAYQYFPWIIAEAKQAIAKGEILPGRYIRVRKMKEQERDHGDLLAAHAALNIIGASCVETLDTKGTDGSNVHLGGPETITGYFGGVGEPNDYALRWLDEFLYYYTNYGVSQVLNINAGTILLGYFLRQAGIQNEFKISVFMGNDNPYSILGTLMLAKLFALDGKATSLIGLNLSNSVNNTTIKLADSIRQAFGFEAGVRFEHHITEAYRGIVRQPYNRREELIELAQTVRNISAKHEGGEIEVEKKRKHPSNILDYFLTKEEILSQGLMDDLLKNFLDKHESVNITARALTEAGIAFEGARFLHR